MKHIASLAAVLCTSLTLSVGTGAHEDERIPEGAPDRVGEVTFPISCNTAAQQEFNRALAMLHSFFYPEAGKTFARVTELDPSCAMGYWGVAMIWWYPLWYPPTKDSLKQGKSAVDKALAMDAKTQRERAYIAAIATFYDQVEQRDHKTRAAAYEKAMAGVHAAFPDDREASVLYALALQATADSNDKTYSKQLESAAILEPVFAEQPNHPGAAHYLIHAYDYPELAPRALPAARRYGVIAPAMPHALHMPSHTYIAVGMWQDSIESNLLAAAAARKLGWVQEEMHSMDYLVYAYLQGAQGGAAQAVVGHLSGVTVGDAARTLPVDYALAAAPARFALEQRRWADAASLAPRASRFPATQALTHYARAIGAAHAGAPADVEKEVQKLAEIRDALLQAKQDYWAKQVEVQRRTAEAWLAQASGDTPRAMELMRSAVDLEESTYKHPITPGQLLPARELLGDLLLEAGQPGPALAEYEISLRFNPNRFNSLYGAARSAELAGTPDKAAVYYRQLLELSQTGDGVRPEIRRAQLFLAGR
jgi:tetratricopeptide (TPR) repeat protein